MDGGDNHDDDEVFTLELADAAGRRASRLADASLELAPRGQLTRAVFLVAGGLLILLGLRSFADDPLYGGFLVVLGLWQFERCGLRSGARRRLITFYQRDPAVLEPRTVHLDRTGFAYESRSTRTWHAWHRFEEVRIFGGGLLVVGRDRRMMQDLPPSAFATSAERDRAQRAITRWIVDAAMADEPPAR